MTGTRVVGVPCRGSLRNGAGHLVSRSPRRTWTQRPTEHLERHVQQRRLPGSPGGLPDPLCCEAAPGRSRRSVAPHACW